MSSYLDGWSVGRAISFSTPPTHFAFCYARFAVFLKRIIPGTLDSDCIDRIFLHTLQYYASTFQGQSSPSDVVLMENWAQCDTEKSTGYIISSCQFVRWKQVISRCFETDDVIDFRNLSSEKFECNGNLYSFRHSDSLCGSLSHEILFFCLRHEAKWTVCYFVRNSDFLMETWKKVQFRVLLSKDEWYSRFGALENLWKHDCTRNR